MIDIVYVDVGYEQLIVVVVSDSVDQEKALQPMQRGSPSPVIVADYLTVASHLEKPMRGPSLIMCSIINYNSEAKASATGASNKLGE